MRRLVPLLATLALAACGSDDGADPIDRVPADGGLRDKVAAAQQVSAADFPSAQGRTFDDLATEVGARDGAAALATSVFVPGTNRLAFGTIDDAGQFTYGKSAVYLANAAGKRLAGPFPAPADLLVTEAPYRSEQAATEGDPFAAVYAAEVNVGKPGEYRLLTVTKTDDGFVSATGAIEVKAKAKDRIPAVGEPAPKVETDTLDSVRGDEALLDTRKPPSDMHESSFADVVGSKPVVLVFATPKFCVSRVCGPVVDVVLELKSRYGDRVEFIHQEVYARNDPARGLREPLVRFGLQTEPWLFAVDRQGKVTARLEGSFGLNAVEQAIETAL